MSRFSHLATIEAKSASLSSEFGLDYASRTFGLTPAQVEEIVGRYTKGKRKGQLRHEIRWMKVTRGGWLRTGPSWGQGERSAGCVVKPGLRFDHVIVDRWKCDDRGNPTVLWSDDFKRFGWIPGETREQYDTRQKVRRELMRPLQTRAFNKAIGIAGRLSDEQVARHIGRREGRFGWLENRYAQTFVAAVLKAELIRRTEANLALPIPHRMSA